MCPDTRLVKQRSVLLMYASRNCEWAGRRETLGSARQPNLSVVCSRRNCAAGYACLMTDLRVPLIWLDKLPPINDKAIKACFFSMVVRFSYGFHCIFRRSGENFPCIHWLTLCSFRTVLLQFVLDRGCKFSALRRWKFELISDGAKVENCK